MNKIGTCQKCGKKNVLLNFVAIDGEVKEVCETCEAEQTEKRRQEKKRGSGPWCSTPKG